MPYEVIQLEKEEKYAPRVKSFKSIPDIYTLNAMHILVEIQDITCFRIVDDLATYL